MTDLHPSMSDELYFKLLRRALAMRDAMTPRERELEDRLIDAITLSGTGAGIPIGTLTPEQRGERDD